MRVRLRWRGVVRLVLSVPVAFALVSMLATTGAVTTCMPELSSTCNGPGPGGGGGPSPTPVPTATSTPAPPQPCPSTYKYRCYAFARLDGAQINGAEATFDSEPYLPPDWADGGHGNQTVWMFDGSGNWCEVGWKQGGQDANGRFTDPFDVYSAYMLGGKYVEADMSFSPGAFGTVHTYKISREANTGVADTFVDAIYVAQCPVTTPSVGMEVGLEYTDQKAVDQGGLSVQPAGARLF